MDPQALIQTLSVWILPVLFAITVHEAAHGYMANRLGDSTAKMMGRLTLNPLKHIDPVGTVIVPCLLLFSGGFIFGWAKPVPINTRNLKQIRRDTALVAIVGPISNIIMALCWGLVTKIGIWMTSAGINNSEFFIYTGNAGIMINCVIGMLNLLPIPPLDGSRVVASLLPPRISHYYNSIEPYGLFILIFMLLMGWLTAILSPLVQFSVQFIVNLYA